MLVCVLLIVPFCSWKIQIMFYVFLNFLFNQLMKMDISSPHVFKKLDSSYCGFCLSSLFLNYDFFFQPFVEQTSPGNKVHYIQDIRLILIEVGVVKIVNFDREPQLPKIREPSLTPLADVPLLLPFSIHGSCPMVSNYFLPTGL
jgi:hypothetical protein